MQEVKQVKRGGQLLYALTPVSWIAKLMGLYLVRVKGFRGGPTYWWSKNYPIRELPNLDKAPCATE